MIEFVRRVRKITSQKIISKDMCPTPLLPKISRGAVFQIASLLSRKRWMGILETAISTIPLAHPEPTLVGAPLNYPI